MPHPIGLITKHKISSSPEKRRKSPARYLTVDSRWCILSNVPKPANLLKVGLSLLRGYLKTRIDAKGRIFLGARVKQELGDTAYILFGSDFHILILSEQNFQQIERHILERVDLTTYEGFLRAMNPNTQKFLRSFYSLHTPVEVDEQGRITIPKFLREQVFLEGELIVYSLGFCIEVWQANKAPKLEHEFLVSSALGEGEKDEGT